MLQKLARTFIFSDNAREAIAENWSTRLDKSDSIQKRKRLKNTYKKCAQLLDNEFNATYVVYILLAQKIRPPGCVSTLVLKISSISTHFSSNY